MSTAVAATVYVTVRCPSCGAERELTASASRRSSGRCPICVRMELLGAPKAEHFRFWLDMFTDWEIVVLVTKIAPSAQVSAEAIAGLRETLSREEMARPVRVLSSVSERAGDLAA